MSTLQPFEPRSPTPRSWWARLVGRSDPENARTSLQAALVEKGPRAITERVLSEILRPHLLRGSQVRRLFVEVYKEALTNFLADSALNDQELEFLDGVRWALNLSQAEIDQLEQETVHPRFKSLLTTVTADHNIDEHERSQLERFRQSTHLPQYVYERLFNETAGAIVQAAADEAMADRRVSDEEWADLMELAQRLGLGVTVDERSRRVFDRFRLLWRIENGDLPAVEVPLNLQKGETCHFSAPVDWHELRAVTRRISYAGPTVSIPIVKGVRFRMGSFAPAVERSDELRHIDTGTVYITNKRILFDGRARNTTIRLAKITSFQMYSDAIVIDRDTGRSPYLFIHGDLELAGVILSAALERA